MRPLEKKKKKLIQKYPHTKLMVALAFNGLISAEMMV